jgi:SWI/SNF-related matrix-associated actin-dependent regulator of chromatin subfamily A-like protein 1
MIKENVKYFECQKRGIDFLSKKKFALLAFEQGLGKTLTALSNRDLSASSFILVVCPAYLVFNWVDEISTHTNFSDLNFRIISYEALTRDVGVLAREEFNYVIFDESHYLKNINAKRTKAAYYLIQMLEANKLQNVVMLTGTPAKNRLESLWSQLRILSIKRPIKNFPLSFFKFKETFIEYETIKYGNSIEVKKEIGIKNKEMLVEMLKDSMLIEKVKNNLDLPDSVTSFVNIMNTKADSLLEKVFQTVTANLKALEKDHISSFKRDVADVKAMATLQFLEDFQENNPDKSIVVFSCHPSAISKIANYLKKDSYFEVNQSLDSEERNEIKNRFQSGERKRLLATIGTFSTGFTLTRAHHMVFNDYPWDFDDLEQAKSRIRRIGQNEKCFYHFIVSGPFDKYILKTIEQKKQVKGLVGL